MPDGSVGQEQLWCERPGLYYAYQIFERLRDDPETACSYWNPGYLRDSRQQTSPD